MFRAGRDLGVPPGRLTAAAAIGAVAGALVCVPAYALITRTYGIGSAALPAAFARAWMVFAEMATGSGRSVPAHALRAAWIAGAAGAALALAARGRLKRWAPSPVAMGVAFIIPASYSVTIALGALALAALRRARPAAAERLALPAGSGAIAGEALTGVLIALLISLGAMRGH